ncbi:Gryzun, putative trafficking through golgi-domain-containing protein [Trametes maxima]|nr:Gryzun, putative trafficking through golgi-domain-containing protein [Trametes maxima]
MNSYPPELLAQLAPRKVAIWQSEKSKMFQVVLVDKDVPFPPRRINRPEEPQHNSAHSPLSPLTPTSPLYPDGIIAPIWVRKHTTLVPSVFVMFMRIYESLPPQAGQDEREREVEEKWRDTDLSAEIALRKKSTNGRGLRLTVVLMATCRMLDDPTLDGRLAYVRQQSGLDPRAALFVLSPVSQTEIGDFVRRFVLPLVPLDALLWEPALEYYTNHSKRVRRKRNRHSQAASYQLPLSPLASAGIARPLRPEGWTVRYEYKMACFAEFRSEDQVALKHYQDAYSTLIIMFGSTAILPPRTKRWAEAKIVKLYLYNNEHSLALSHQNSHMRRFADFSRGWGIGEETFEFWSWLARQHRVFAELLEQGTRSNLKIPSAYPTPTPSATMLAAQSLEALQMGSEAMRVLGLNPNQALQHPVFYYYMAARCTERRRERFISMLDSESNSPGFVNEKKVDYLAIVLELYTRSYELFKKWSPQNAQNPGRLTLWIAYRIAQTSYESGKFDMAVRFFERIAKTYRRESWESLLHPLLSQWYACAQQLGDVDLSVKLLVEMLGHGENASADDPDALQDDLLVVTTHIDLLPMLTTWHSVDASVVFWDSETNVRDQAPFQILLSSQPNVSLSSIPFTSLAEVHFSVDVPPVIIKHAQQDPDEEITVVQRLDLGQIQVTPGATDPTEFEMSLRWGPRTTVVFSGSVLSATPMQLRLSVTKIVFTIKQNSWWIEVPVIPAISSLEHALTAPRWLFSVDPPRFVPVRREDHSAVRIHYRNHYQVQVAISHDGPAYIGEEFPIDINIRNEDDRELDVVLDVLLQPTEIDEAVNYIAMDDQRSTSLLKAVACGVLTPGASILKRLHLTNAGAPGERVVDNLLPVSPKSPTSPASPGGPPLVDKTETLRTLTVAVVQPIEAAHAVVYRRPTKLLPGLLDLAMFEGDVRDEAAAMEAVVTSTVTVVAPAGLVIESVVLHRKDTESAEIVDCSVDGDDFSGEWLAGDEFCDRCRIGVIPDEEYPEAPIPGPGEYEVTWRRLLRAGGQGPRSTTRLPLPPLLPPSDGLIALLDAPTTARLHTPIPLRLTIRNRHPTRSAAATVQLEPDGAAGRDAFVVAGPRHARVPVLLPGQDVCVTWNLVPIECGRVRVPRVRVLDRRSGQSEGDEIEVVDVRWEERPERVEDEDEGGSLSHCGAPSIVLEQAANNHRYAFSRPRW